jgi:putative aldouronate transport system substrate-binding protein
MPVFSAVKGEKPWLSKGAPASIFSFVKKNDDKSKIKEMLALANVLAAPFGTTEFDLIQNGVEGVHYTVGPKGVPIPTALAAKELQPTYVFLVDPPTANAKVQFPGYVKAASEWELDASKYLVEPLFYGMQINEPVQYASLAQPFSDLEGEICRGRKSLKDLDAAVATWKSSGGEELRAFYQAILDKK